MKVLIDTTPLDTGHAVRGIGTYTRLLTQHLEWQSDLKVVRSGTPESAEFDPDLVHYPYFDLFFNTLPVIKKKPTVVTVHDVIPLKFPDHYQPGIKGRARFLQQKTTLKTVKAVITDSASSQADIEKHLGVPTNKIHVIYLAAHPELKKTSQQEVRRVRRKYGLPRRYVLYVGDINYNKNIPQLIKAARELPQYYKLVCLGQSFYEHDIPEWRWIKTQVALSDVENKVKFVTDVPGGAIQDMASIYTGAECYVQPSFYEGFGLPILEAMQCQAPVVCTQTSSLTEVGGEHVLFAQPQADDLAAKINQVLQWTQTQRREKVRSAYIWSQKFSWDKTAQQTIKVYQRAVSHD